jgi:hypothetical protein
LNANERTLIHFLISFIKQARRCRPGGEVQSKIRLAVALRYLAGGQIIDLALIYHISKRECYSSLWLVVDAINKHPALAI